MSSADVRRSDVPATGSSRAAIARRRRSPAARRRARMACSAGASASSGAPARSELVRGLLVVALRRRSSPCAAAQPADLGRRPPARGAPGGTRGSAGAQRMQRRPSASQVTGQVPRPAAPTSSSPARGDAERLGPVGGDLVEQRGHHQEARARPGRARRGSASRGSRAAGRPRRRRRWTWSADRHASKSTPVTQPPVACDGARRVDTLPPGELERLRRLLGRERQLSPRRRSRRLPTAAGRTRSIGDRPERLSSDHAGRRGA